MKNPVDNYDDHKHSNNNSTDFKVTPWEVEGDINYGKLIEKFGTQPITPELLQKIKSMTGEIHPLLKSGYFFSHRDFDWILDKKSRGESFYLYTGRGPSGMVHMGHLMPWIFTKYLQDKFGSKLLFQLTDDEKFLHSQARTRDEIKHFTYENILDIIAVGFDPNNTKIIGMVVFPQKQAPPFFLPSIIEEKPPQLLIPAAIDQDPYWRMTRDIAE